MRVAIQPGFLGSVPVETKGLGSTHLPRKVRDRSTCADQLDPQQETDQP